MEEDPSSAVPVKIPPVPETVIPLLEAGRIKQHTVHPSPLPIASQLHCPGVCSLIGPPQLMEHPASGHHQTQVVGGTEDMTTALSKAAQSSTLMMQTGPSTVMSTLDDDKKSIHLGPRREALASSSSVLLSGYDDTEQRANVMQQWNQLIESKKLLQHAEMLLKSQANQMINTNNKRRVTEEINGSDCTAASLRPPTLPSSLHDIKTLDQVSSPRKPTSGNYFRY